MIIQTLQHRLSKTLVRTVRWTQQHVYLLRYAHFQHFEAHLGQKKKAMENSINVSLLSMFLQELKSSFSRWPSSCAQWEVHSAELEKHLKYIL